MSVSWGKNPVCPCPGSGSVRSRRTLCRKYAATPWWSTSTFGSPISATIGSRPACRWIGAPVSRRASFDLAKFRAVGLEINASHLRAATGGHVEGICRPVRLGRTVHVWQIDVFDDNGRQVCTCRLTMAVLPLD
jgi:hypothetical protein